MRSLYESILDTDDQLKDKSKVDESAVLIVKCFHEVFGDLLPNDRPDSDYIVGIINTSEWNLGNTSQFYHADKILEQKVKEFRKAFKKRIKGSLTYKTTARSTHLVYTKNYRFMIELRPSERDFIVWSVSLDMWDI